MHALHLVAVEADNHEEAVEEAESALDHYGNGDVWDWYEIGGRWKGIFGENEDGTPKNVLCFTEDPESFQESLENIIRSQNKNLRDLLDKLTGRTISEPEVSSLWGMPVTDRKGAAERITAQNKQYYELFKKLLTLEEVPSGPNLQSGFGMLGFYMMQLGKLLCGSYAFESYFYDVHEGATRPLPVLDRCKSGDGERQYLVAFDLHN